MNGFEHPSPSYWFLKAESPYHTLFFSLVSLFFKLSESSQKRPIRTVKLKQNTRTKRNRKQRIEEEGKTEQEWID